MRSIKSASVLSSFSKYKRAAMIWLLDHYLHYNPALGEDPSWMITSTKTFVSFNHILHTFPSTPVELPLIEIPCSTILSICPTTGSSSQFIEVIAISMKVPIEFVLDYSTSIFEARSTCVALCGGGRSQCRQKDYDSDYFHVVWCLVLPQRGKRCFWLKIEFNYLVLWEL